MKKSDVSKLLTMAAATDNRTLGESDVTAWHAILTESLGEDTPFDDLRKALVNHYGTSHQYLMPIHITEFVRLLRRTRLAMIKPVAPPELLDDNGYPPVTVPQVHAYQDWFDTVRQQIRNGQYQPDPPADVLRRDMQRIDEGLDRGFYQPWPNPNPAPAIESASNESRDMSSLDNVVKTV